MSINKVVLRLLDIFQGFFRWLGADYEVLRYIVEVKFIIQNRRPLTTFHTQSTGSKDQNPNNSFWMMVGIQCFLGLLIGSLLFFLDIPYLAYGLIFAYTMVMSIYTLITDFSTLLLDTTDNVVLLSRPVDSRTILMARLVHIISYILTLAFGISFFTLIFTLIKYGLIPLIVSILLIISLTVISVFVTAILYMLIMQLASEERLKDIISYFQILFTILITFGYQTISRLFNLFDLENAKIAIQAWHYFLPPLWMSGTMQLVIKHDTTFWPFVGLALTIPVLCLWLLIRFLAPQYNAKMAALSNSDSGGSERVINQKRNGLAHWVAAKVTTSQLEKAIFELSWKITSRDRRFKMRTYPSFGMVIPLLFVFGKDTFNPATWAQQSDGYSFLLVLYFVHVILATFYSQSFFSEDFQARWVYFATPTDSPRDVIMGNFKAILIKFYTPVYVLIAGLVLTIWGYKALDDILLAYLLSCILILSDIYFKRSQNLPFAKSPTEQKKAEQTLQAFLLVILLPICGFGHWGLTSIPFAIPISCILALFLLLFLYNKYDSLTWDKFDL